MNADGYLQPSYRPNPASSIIYWKARLSQGPAGRRSVDARGVSTFDTTPLGLLSTSPRVANGLPVICVAKTGELCGSLHAEPGQNHSYLEETLRRTGAAPLETRTDVLECGFDSSQVQQLCSISLLPALLLCRCSEI